MNYLNKYVPDNYRCHRCGVHGVKLWRESNSFSINLMCAVCSCITQGKNYHVGDDGKNTDEDGICSDQIGWYVPAVPCEDATGYWGYTSVPEAGCYWWDRLPVRK